MGTCICKDKFQDQDSCELLTTSNVNFISKENNLNSSLPSKSLDLSRSPSFKLASQNKYASLKGILLPNQGSTVPFLTLNQVSSNEEIQIPERNKSKVTTIVTPNHYTISVFETENQDIHPSDVYYQQDKSPVTRNKSATAMPRKVIPLMTQEEIRLERKVTKSMRDGEGYEKVEEAFSKYIMENKQQLTK